MIYPNFFMIYEEIFGVISIIIFFETILNYIEIHKMFNQIIEHIQCSKNNSDKKTFVEKMIIFWNISFKQQYNKSTMKKYTSMKVLFLDRSTNIQLP